MKTAIVIGATGLVGRRLVQMLLHDDRFVLVKIFVRRSAGIANDKLEEHIVDFDAPDEWKHLVTGDVLYSAMGTTLHNAGSKAAQYKVDYTYQYRIAKIAAANDVSEYVLVSAAGAAADSKLFYPKMKGELERDVRRLPFETIHIIRPGMLEGQREEKRTGEKFGAGVMKVISSIPGLGKLKPITDAEVAQAMINATFIPVVGLHTYTMGEVFKLAEPTE